MSLSTVKIDFTKLNESETKEVLSHIQEYENTCEAAIRTIENTNIASNVLQTVAAGAAGALSFSIIDNILKNNDALSTLEKTLLFTGGAIELVLCTAIMFDNIDRTAKVISNRKKRIARANILNADTKAELGIGKILLKKQEEENTKNKKK